MKEINSGRHSIDIAFVLCLFLVFTVMLLSVLFLGINAYDGISGKATQNYESRTTMLYVSNKIKAYGNSENVTIEPFEGINALALREKIDGEDYVTRIYCYKGYLMELFTEEGNVLDPVAGAKIMRVKSFEPSYAGDGLIKIEIGSNEATEYAYMNLN